MTDLSLASAQEPTSPRILIVDDDAGTIRLLGQIVRDLGTVFFATNGDDAIRMTGEIRPDLILLDAEMGSTSGFETCRKIKSDPAFLDIPILFVTSHKGIDSEIAALDAGAVDFITKPPSPPIVRARVRTHLMLKERTDALHRIATIDGLTGVSNRLAFDMTLDEEWRRARRAQSPLTLAMIDIDYFKKYNDSLGHPAGDDCLRLVARTLAGTLHRAGDLVARFGGEEFAAIMPNCSNADAPRLGEALRQAISDLRIPHKMSPVQGIVTISVGVASLSYETTAAPIKIGSDNLIACADAALYDAKHRGRNRVATDALKIPLFQPALSGAPA